MKKLKGFKKVLYLLIVCAAIGLIVTLQSYVSANDPVNEKTVTDAVEFGLALEDTSIDVIKIDGSVEIAADTGSDDLLVISRPVTIQGGRLSLRKAGIILGADVTFKDMEIGFLTSTRNAIIANGYVLTLENVKKNSSAPFSIYLFCGGISDYNGSDADKIPEAKAAGQIVIRGENTLGDIFAGSLSDGSDEEKAKNNDFKGTSTITIDPQASGTIGSIYAHGAREDRSGGAGDVFLPNPEKYIVSGAVTINLNNGLVKTVYGATGGTDNAKVVYTDDGRGYQTALLLNEVGSLDLSSGSGKKADVLLNSKSSFSGEGKVSLPSGTVLTLKNLETAVLLPALSGGGTVILGENQTLTIPGKIEGATKVAIGGVSFDGNYSTGTVNKGHTYIAAVQSEAGSFNLLPTSALPDLAFTKDDSGNWSIPSDEPEETPDPSLKKNTIAAVGTLSHTYDGTAFSLSVDKGTHFNWNGTGTATINGYYLNEGKTLTTAANSGAAGEGQAPVSVGSYYVKVTVSADETYDNTTAYIPFSIAVKENTPSYTVTYHAGQGSGSMSNGTAFEGMLFTLPVSTFIAPKGKEFSGWLIEGKEYEEGATYLFTKNTDVTAVWKEISKEHVHSGGKATCISPAICTGCSQAYGEKDSSNHTGGTVTKGKVEATKTTNGYTGDTWCLGCNVKISTGTVIPATGTSSGGGSNSGSGNGSTGSTGSGTGGGTGTAANGAGNTGSGSSGSGSGSGSTQTTTGTIPASGATNTAQIKVTITDTTATLSLLSQSEINSLLSGNSTNNPIIFDVSGTGKKVDTVNLPRENLKTFADSSSVGGLQIKLSTGIIKLDMKALKAIVDQSSGDTIRLVVNNAGTSLLNENQKKSCETMKLHGAAEIYFLSVAENKRISDLGGGIMTAGIPFSIPSGLSSGDFLVWYIDDTGTRTKLTSWYEGDKIYWQVGHNSTFIVSYGTAAAVNTSVKAPKTGEETSAGLSKEFIGFFILMSIEKTPSLRQLFPQFH